MAVVDGHGIGGLIRTTDAEVDEVQWARAGAGQKVGDACLDSHDQHILKLESTCIRTFHHHPSTVPGPWGCGLQSQWGKTGTMRGTLGRPRSHDGVHAFPPLASLPLSCVAPLALRDRPADPGRCSLGQEPKLLRLDGPWPGRLFVVVWCHSGTQTCSWCFSRTSTAGWPDSLFLGSCRRPRGTAVNGLSSVAHTRCNGTFGPGNTHMTGSNIQPQCSSAAAGLLIISIPTCSQG